MSVTILSATDKMDIYVANTFGNITKAQLARNYNVSARTIGRVVDEIDLQVMQGLLIQTPPATHSYDEMLEEYKDILDAKIQLAEDFEDDDEDEDWYDYDEDEDWDDDEYNDDYTEPTVRYNVVATSGNINLYRTDYTINETIQANLSSEDDKIGLFDEVFDKLRGNVDNQDVLEECFNSIHKQTAIESASKLGNIKVEPTAGRVYYENEGGRVTEFSGELVHRIIKLLGNENEEHELNVLVAFAERLSFNPSQRAINELYEFIKHSDIVITKEGMVECYKRIRSDFKDIYTGTMDNSLGKTLEVSRSEVDPDSSATCSYGLHVCSKTYLPFYGASLENVVVKVLVNPADFVSIPSDYNEPIIDDEECGVAPSKARVCKYTVIAIASDPDLI